MSDGRDGFEREGEVNNSECSEVGVGRQGSRLVLRHSKQVHDEAAGNRQPPVAQSLGDRRSVIGGRSAMVLPPTSVYLLLPDN